MVEPVANDRPPRSSEADRMQRIRVGVTGLAAVVLVVIVATAISTGVRTSAESANVAAAAPPPVVATVDSANSTESPSEPLAQLGAAPGAKTDEKPPPTP